MTMLTLSFVLNLLLNPRFLNEELSLLRKISLARIFMIKLSFLMTLSITLAEAAR